MDKLDQLSEEELEERIHALMQQREELLEEQRALKVVLSQRIAARNEARRIEVENDPKLKALVQGVGL